MKTICKIANLMIFVSVAIILFTEIYATFNCWTLDSSILNVNFTTILIVALTVRVGLIDFKSKDENDKKGVKFMAKFIKDALTSFVSFCMIAIVFQFCCESSETAFWILVMAFSLNALVILTGILADAQKRKLDKMLKDKLDEMKSNE